MKHTPHEKVRHVAGKISGDGQVSALCFDPPGPIRLAVASWVSQAKRANCEKCLAILKARGVDIETHSVFNIDIDEKLAKEIDTPIANTEIPT